VRKIINCTFISLDGVVERPNEWPTVERPANGQSGQMHVDLIEACDAVLMGRHTYDGFAAAWPTRSGDPFSDRINTIPKYVVSTTLTDPEWANTTVIATDVPQAVAKLKAEPGQDIVLRDLTTLPTGMLIASYTPA
jgi:dihydrofolate reductase